MRVILKFSLNFFVLSISFESTVNGLAVYVLCYMNGKLILTLILSKMKLSIHITQDVPMIFVYPYLELTGVNKHLSIKLRKTGTVFQMF